MHYVITFKMFLQRCIQALYGSWDHSIPQISLQVILLNFQILLFSSIKTSIKFRRILCMDMTDTDYETGLFVG